MVAEKVGDLYAGGCCRSSVNATTGEATLGKVIGPDGLPFFKVDAPHGAPSISKDLVAQRNASCLGSLDGKSSWENRRRAVRTQRAP